MKTISQIGNSTRGVGRICRWSLRSWLFATIVANLGLGCYVNHYANRASALNLIRERGGSVDWQKQQSWLSQLSVFIFADERGSCVKRIVLNGTSITETELTRITVLKEVEDLDLNNTSLGDAALQVVSRLPQLRKLELSDTNISDTGLAHLQRCRALEELHLAWCKITSDGCMALAQCHNLKRLSLQGTEVDDRGVRAIAKLEQLVFLQLGGDAFTDACIDDIIKIRGLKLIFIYGNHAISQKGIARLLSFLPDCKVSR